jgi:hypothetical protein
VRAVFHLETAAKPLKLLERVLAAFSKCALKLLDNEADFDSAIRRFDPSRPSQEPRHDAGLVAAEIRPAGLILKISTKMSTRKKSCDFAKHQRRLAIHCG